MELLNNSFSSEVVCSDVFFQARAVVWLPTDWFVKLRSDVYERLKSRSTGCRLVSTYPFTTQLKNITDQSQPHAGLQSPSACVQSPPSVASPALRLTRALWALRLVRALWALRFAGGLCGGRWRGAGVNSSAGHRSVASLLFHCARRRTGIWGHRLATASFGSLSLCR